MLSGVITAWICLLCINLIFARNPILNPTTTHLCPNSTVIIYICMDTNISIMTWWAEPYIPRNRPISYSAGIIFTRNTSMVFHEGSNGNFYSNLTNIVFNNENQQFADTMTTTLTVITTNIANGTSVTCETFRGAEEFSKTSVLYITESPKWRISAMKMIVSNSMAVLDLEEIFDGGGVPIDHYIIQLDNGTQLETTNSTYSFDIMYNTTLSVNISAHNCAGYSPFFPIVIQYKNIEKESVSLEVEDIQNYTRYIPAPTTRPTIHTPTRNNRNINTLEIALIIYSFVVSVIACVLPVYLIVKCFKKKRITVRTQNKVNMKENTAYGVTVSGPDYNMENNPLYAMRMESKESI